MVDALTIAYRGTDYAGWQRQTNALAVQQVVEEALETVLGHRITIHGAGRTDAGVHARGQVAHFDNERDFPSSGLVAATNRHLPSDIRILSACRMPAGFHARKHAAAKEYRYRLVAAQVLSPLDSWFAVRCAPGIDHSALEAAAVRLRGRHDFSAFALAGGAHKTSERSIFEAEWRRQGGELCFRVVGDGFLRGMVRSLVGTMLEVGTGRRDLESFAALLGGGERSAAGPTAPPQGLVLYEVRYDEPWRPLAVQ